MREVRAAQAAGDHRDTVHGAVHPRLAAEGHVSHVRETHGPSHPHAVLHGVNRDHAGDGGQSAELRDRVPEVLRVAGQGRVLRRVRKELVRHVRQLGLENHTAEPVRFGRHCLTGLFQAVDRFEVHVLRIHRVLSQGAEGHARAIKPSAEGPSTLGRRRREKYGFDNTRFN